MSAPENNRTVSAINRVRKIDSRLVVPAFGFKEPLELGLAYVQEDIDNKITHLWMALTVLAQYGSHLKPHMKVIEKAFNEGPKGHHTYEPWEIIQ